MICSPLWEFFFLIGITWRLQLGDFSGRRLILPVRNDVGVLNPHRRSFMNYSFRNTSGLCNLGFAAVQQVMEVVFF